MPVFVYCKGLRREEDMTNRKNKKEIKQDPFKEYRRAEDPSQREKAHYWRTAIGLQAVDGLTPSAYLVETAKKHVEGEIASDDVYRLLDSYYAEKGEDAEPRAEEADKVSARIAMLLSEGGFTFSVAELLNIHRRLFEGIYPHAGTFRTYNITKREWVLDGDTVTYGTAPELRATLEYDLDRERNFRYKGLTSEQRIRHFATFLSGLWQIHPFAEGNTRAVAVFFIKYLRSLGYDGVTNDVFAEHSLYFRNALVRANYTNLRVPVQATTEYLELFLRNVLYGEDNLLKNRALHVFSSVEQDIGDRKQDIVDQKQDIDKPSSKTESHIKALFSEFAARHNDRFRFLHGVLFPLGVVHLALANHRPDGVVLAMLGAIQPSPAKRISILAHLALAAKDFLFCHCLI